MVPRRLHAPALAARCVRGRSRARALWPCATQPLPAPPCIPNTPLVCSRRPLRSRPTTHPAALATLGCDVRVRAPCHARTRSVHAPYARPRLYVCARGCATMTAAPAAGSRGKPRARGCGRWGGQRVGPAAVGVERHAEAGAGPVCMHACMRVCNVWMYVCMHVCVCVCVMYVHVSV